MLRDHPISSVTKPRRLYQLRLEVSSSYFPTMAHPVWMKGLAGRARSINGSAVHFNFMFKGEGDAGPHSRVAAESAKPQSTRTKGKTTIIVSASDAHK